MAKPGDDGLRAELFGSPGSAQPTEPAPDDGLFVALFGGDENALSAPAQPLVAELGPVPLPAPAEPTPAAPVPSKTLADIGGFDLGIQHPGVQLHDFSAPEGPPSKRAQGLRDLVAAAANPFPFEGIREEIKKRGEYEDFPLAGKALFDLATMGTFGYSFVVNSAATGLEDMFGAPPGVPGDPTGGYMAPWTKAAEQEREASGESQQTYPYMARAAANEKDWQAVQHVVSAPESLVHGAGMDAFARKMDLAEPFAKFAKTYGSIGQWVLVDSIRKLGMRNKRLPIYYLADALMRKEDIPELVRSTLTEDPDVYARLRFGPRTGAGVRNEVLAETSPVELAARSAFMAGMLPEPSDVNPERRKAAREFIMRAAKEGRLGQDVAKTAGQFVNYIDSLDDPMSMSINDSHIGRYCAALARMPADIYENVVHRAYGTDAQQDEYLNDNPGFYVMDRLLPVYALGKGLHGGLSVGIAISEPGRIVADGVLSGVQKYAREVDAANATASLRGVRPEPVVTAVVDASARAMDASTPLDVLHNVFVDQPAKTMLALPSGRRTVMVPPLSSEAAAKADKSFRPTNLDQTAMEREVSLMIDGDRATILEFQRDLSEVVKAARDLVPDLQESGTLESFLVTMAKDALDQKAGGLITAISTLKNEIKQAFNEAKLQPSILGEQHRRVRELLQGAGAVYSLMREGAQSIGEQAASLGAKLELNRSKMADAIAKKTELEQVYASAPKHPDLLRVQATVAALEEEAAALGEMGKYINPRARVEGFEFSEGPASFVDLTTPIAVKYRGAGPKFELVGGDPIKRKASNLPLEPTTMARVVDREIHAGEPSAVARKKKTRAEAWARFDQWKTRQAELARTAGMSFDEWVRKIPVDKRVEPPRIEYNFKVPETPDARMELAVDKWQIAQRKLADAHGVTLKQYLETVAAETKAEGLAVRGVTDTAPYEALGLHPVQTELFASKAKMNVQRFAGVAAPKGRAKHALGDLNVPIVEDMNRRYFGQPFDLAIKDLRKDSIARAYGDTLPSWAKRVAYVVDFVEHPFGWFNLPKLVQNVGEWYLTNTPRQNLSTFRSGATAGQSVGLFLAGLLTNKSYAVGADVFSQYLRAQHRAAFQLEAILPSVNLLEKRSMKVSIHDPVNGPIQSRVDSAVSNRIVNEAAMMIGDTAKEFDLEVTFAGGRRLRRAEVQDYLREVAGVHGEGSPEMVAAIRSVSAPERVRFVPRRAVSELSEEERGKQAVKQAVLDTVAQPVTERMWDLSSQAILGGFRLVEGDAGQVVKRPLLRVDKYIDELGGYMSAYFDGSRLYRFIVAELDEAIRRAPGRSGVVSSEMQREITKGVLDKYDAILGQTVEPGGKRMLSEILKDPKISTEVRAELARTREHLGSPVMRFFEHPLWKSKDYDAMRSLGLWDARESVAASVGNLANTLEMQKFFLYLRENGLLKTDADAPLVAGTPGGMPELNKAGWHRVPPDMVGALNDLGNFYVEGNTLKFLLGEGRQLGQPWLAVAQMTSMWKLGKIANPFGTIPRNIMANFATLGWIGETPSNPLYVVRAANILAREEQPKAYRFWRAEGFGGRTVRGELDRPFEHQKRAAAMSIISREMRDASGVALGLGESAARLGWMENILTGKSGAETRKILRIQNQKRPVEADPHARIWGLVKDGTIRAHHWTSSFYGAIDDSFKFGYVLQGIEAATKRIGRELTDAELRGVVQEWGGRGNKMFLDYADVSPLIEWTRSGLLAGAFGPFVTFQYKAMGRLFEAMAENPLRVWGFMSMARANLTAAQIVNQTPDDLFDAVSGDPSYGFVPYGTVPQPVPPRIQRDPETQELGVSRPTTDMNSASLISMGNLSPQVGDSPGAMSLMALTNILSSEDSLLQMLGRSMTGEHLKRDRNDPDGYTTEVAGMEDVLRLLNPASASVGVAKLLSALSERRVAGARGSLTGTLQSLASGASVRGVNLLNERKRLIVVRDRAVSRIRSDLRDAYSGNGEYAGKTERQRNNAVEKLKAAIEHVKLTAALRLTSIAGKVVDDVDFKAVLESYMVKHGLGSVIRPEPLKPVKKIPDDTLLRSHRSL